MRKNLILAAGFMAAALAPLSAHAQSGPLSSIFNCTASGNKQETGALIGAAVGGVIGNQLSKRDRTLGTAVGVALGAAAGSYIGCRMQVDDQAKAEAAARTALDSGTSQAWNNAATGASGSTTVIPVSNSSGAAASVRLAGNVTPVNLTAGSGQYQAVSTANVRASASTSASILGRLSAQQKVDVIAQVTGQPWYLLGQNGIGVGYVSASLLRPVTSSPAAVSTVANSGNCKVIEQTYTPPGQSATVERYNACKDAAGQWQLTRI
jgi:surface antigen